MRFSPRASNIPSQNTQRGQRILRGFRKSPHTAQLEYYPGWIIEPIIGTISDTDDFYRAGRLSLSGTGSHCLSTPLPSLQMKRRGGLEPGSRAGGPGWGDERDGSPAGDPKPSAAPLSGRVTAVSTMSSSTILGCLTCAFSFPKGPAQAGIIRSKRGQTAFRKILLRTATPRFPI